ncbi:MAG: hypothetical protein M1813_004997 [Trichoglossum hirsutum]|nr:MAG: hypothetical protein M1813_004997 [Trichoglossum hirsutum]
MSLMFVKYPYPRSVKQLIDNGGYGQLGSQNSQPANTVLFSVDGAQPSTRQVRMAISRDGRDRALHWPLANEGGAVVRVDNRILDHTHGAWDEYAKVKQAGTVHRLNGSVSDQGAQWNDEMDWKQKDSYEHGTGGRFLCLTVDRPLTSPHP